MLCVRSYLALGLSCLQVCAKKWLMGQCLMSSTSPIWLKNSGTRQGGFLNTPQVDIKSGLEFKGH